MGVLTLQPTRPPQPFVGPAMGRAGRVALVGLLLPAAALALASAAGVSLPDPLRRALPVVPYLAFAASGAWTGAVIGADTRARRILTAGFGTAGLLIVPAYGSLTGLTGREPVAVAAGVVGSAFAVGFGVAAASAAAATNLSKASAVGAGIRGTLAGILGGFLALGPFLTAAAGLTLDVPFGNQAVAVGAVMGGILLPFRLVGAALDAAIRDPT